MSLLRGLKGFVGLALVASVITAHPAILRAQTTSASVSGTVQDSQGGVLPGVTVTLTSRTQGNVLTAVTDEGGRFVFPIVRPDTYTLQVTLQGFKTLERTNVVVNANDKLSTGTLTLEVGGMTEEVSVTAASIELQSNSGERSFTLESQALKNIANNGRMLFNFATLVPGALSQNTGNTELGSVSGFTVNGQRPELEQHHDRRRRQHRHRRQRRQHGDDEHRRRRRVQDPDQRLPGGVRARRRRPDAGRHQERHAELPRLRLLVRTALGLGRQHVAEQARNAGDPEAGDRRATTPATRFGGPVAFPGFNEDKKKLFFFWSQEFQRRTNPATLHQTTRADGARAARGFLAERRQQRQSVPVHPRLHHRAAVQRRATRAAVSRTAACSAGFRRTASMRPASPR